VNGWGGSHGEERKAESEQKTKRKKKDKSEMYYDGEGIKFFEWVSRVSIMFTIIGAVVLRRRRRHGE